MWRKPPDRAEVAMPVPILDALGDLRECLRVSDDYYHSVDLPFYRSKIAEFIPDRIIDIHSHVTCPEEIRPGVPRETFWANRVCPDGMDLPGLLEVNELIFPGKSVTPVVFPMPSGRLDMDIGNRYVAREAPMYGAIPLMLTHPGWEAEHLAEMLDEGGFRGLKPYPNMAQDKEPDEIEIYDYLPREHLALADERGLLVILHIPRSGRLADSVNIMQLREIDEDFPRARVVVAHVGRAYCRRFGSGIDDLGDTQNIAFDISANTNREVFERLVRTIEPGRILYGSDLPIPAMHSRRVCEGNNYVNIVLGADWEDGHTRAAGQDEGVTFFLYEAIAAFLGAAEKEGLSEEDMRKIFYTNGEKMLGIEEEG